MSANYFPFSHKTTHKYTIFLSFFFINVTFQPLGVGCDITGTVVPPGKAVNVIQKARKAP